MKLGEQIKENRNRLSLSQENLAEKMYVSRQTISNWENGKTYPDINSLVLLSEIFDTTIDNLVKGDIETMKELINNEDVRRFNRLSGLYTVLFLVMIVSPIPLIHFLGKVGFALWGIVAAVTMYFAIRVEKFKKEYDIQTFKEILAFFDGEKLDEIAKTREEGKKPYQKFLAAFIFAVITGIVTIFFMEILG